MKSVLVNCHITSFSISKGKCQLSIVYPEYKLSQTLLVKISFFSKIKIHIDISIQFMKIDFLNNFIQYQQSVKFILKIYCLIIEDINNFL